LTRLRGRVGLVLWAVGLGAGGQAQAAALLHALFQDHVVLQRDRPIEVWGHAVGDEVVTVSLADSSVTAHADASGEWSAVLPARSAGGPYVLTARGSSGAQQSTRDVLVGDVFLCSGQSNMELPVKRSGDPDAEIRSSTNDTIRMLTVKHASSMAPRSEFTDTLSWQIAAPATVPEWSATCFYFAREMQKLVHVPMGLVHSSWGGSNIRPWIGAETLHANGSYESALGVLALYANDPTAAQERFGKEWEQWWRGKTGDKPGTEPWQVAASGGDWQPAPAELGDWRYWGVAQLKDFSGVLWYRTVITLSAAQARTATRLDLGAINQVDETWINGHVLGNTFGYDADRTYNIRPGLLHPGANVLVVNASSDYGSRGMLAGGKPRALYFSDGTSAALRGPWQYRVVPSAVGYPPRSPWEPVGGITTLYNAMIAPLGHFGFKAALWYQGESNTSEPGTYEGLLTGLMADWRRQFGTELPFLIVQLPNYGPLSSQPVESHWAELREAQKQAVAKDPHAGLAVTIDIGEPDNLHPTNKQDVGRRLARAARHVVYGESIAPSGPVATRATRGDGAVVVDFTDIEQQLVAYSHQAPIAFELCGDAPRTCQFSEARIEGNTVVLPVPAASAPTRVRYCWADSPVCTLFDSNGLPAGPFEIRISGSASPSQAHAAQDHRRLTQAAHAATPRVSRPPITGISHIAVYAAAPEKSERFYVHDLGAVKGPDPENPRGTRYYFSPTQFVEVLPLPDAPASSNRLDHVAFTTTDAAALREYLHVSQKVTTGSDGSQWLTVKDPEGNRIEFVQSSARVPDIPANPLSRHIIHVGFIIHDRTREDDFFKAKLGFRPYWFGGMTDDKTQWISQQVPDGTDWLEYMVVSSPQISAADRGVLNHFSLGVPDMETAYTLLWNGARLDGQSGTPRIGRDAKWQLNLFDPDGTRAEIMELHAIGTPCCSPFTASDPHK
jgi:sialate O-acetylesterase